MVKYVEDVIGLMSGTSLDGLDICLSHFSYRGPGLHHEILKAETIPYSEEWTKKLQSAEKCSGEELIFLHYEYGKFLGEQVNDFLKRHSLKKPGLVSSHGHTIFHRPDKGYTFQLGSGASLAAECGMAVVCDFRSTDVALGGQGAPLVPFGDFSLYLKANYNGRDIDRLNLGGFANITFNENHKLAAFDICPANYVLNRLAQREGKVFDENGMLSSSGKIIPELLEKLNSFPFYKKSPPKSLGREWVKENIFPLLDSAEFRNLGTANLLRTFTEHVADQVSIQGKSTGKMMVTGGGAHNAFLISRLKEKCKSEVVIPDQQIVDFKEAHLFAYMGWLRWNEEHNVFETITGARESRSLGAIYM